MVTLNLISGRISHVSATDNMLFELFKHDKHYQRVKSIFNVT